MRIVIMAVIIAIFVTFLAILVVLYVDLRKHLYLVLKKTLYSLSHNNANNNNSRGIMVEYSDKDEEFVLKEVLPGMRHHLDLEIHTNVINNSARKQGFMNSVTGTVKETYTTLVIFSPNYLTSNYSHVNIKKIRGEMLKAKNTIFVFADIGPENSIYAFLKEQRDTRTTVMWNDQEFWNTFLAIIAKGDHKVKRRRVNKLLYAGKMKLESNRSISRPPDTPNIYALDAFTHMQV